MSKYTEAAMEMRRLSPEGRPMHNCCQSTAVPFAEDLGCDRDMCMKMATYFRGGMQMGSVCGAVTGGLMALGMAGLNDPDTSTAFLEKVRNANGGRTDCRDFLEEGIRKGEAKTETCSRIICFCVGCVEEILKEKGIL